MIYCLHTGYIPAQGKFEDVEAMHRQTLVLEEKILGKEHPSTLTSMNNLAGVLDSQGKYEAEAMYRQTLGLCENVLGKEPPDTLTSVYCLQDLSDKATTLYQRACDSYSMVLGDYHSIACPCQRDYLGVLRRKEQRQ
jgi:hypothetical protein